jgi:L-asparaginase
MSANAKPRICILYTGGTIAMLVGRNGVKRPPEDPADFLNIAPQVRTIAEISFYPILNKDSIDMVVSDWITIARAIYDRRKDGYSGFVVVHGTDTMAFSASAVAFALGPHLNFPVVFVGGQTVAALVHGDGQINLIRACIVALKPLAEVVICFNDSVFRACRAQKRDDRDFDAFESPGFEPLCDIKDRIELRPHARRPLSDGPDIDLKATFSDGILMILMNPVTPPEMLMPVIESHKCTGLILQTFGGGNVPIQDGFTYIHVIQRATELGKPVVVTSLFPSNPNEYQYLNYESGIKAKNEGAIQISGLVFPALMTKFSWVLPQLGQIPDKSKKFEVFERLMKTPYVGEIDSTPGFA